MFITIAASIVCVSVVLLPAAAEIGRMLDERQAGLHPLRLNAGESGSAPTVE